MLRTILSLLALTLILLNGASIATAMEESDVTVISGAAIPFAKEDHLAYGIVKVWNKADKPVNAILSISPNQDHPLDDNKHWGNYKDNEKITIGANELHVHAFCFIIPTNSNAGKQTWTLNVSAGEQIITKEIAIDLPVTKNVEVVAPSWQPDILKLDFPPAKPDTIIVEASKPKVILAMLKVAGDLGTAKIYDVQLDTTLPDIFFSYPEKITMAMSVPENWNFENQEFLPFTVIPVSLLTVNVPYSSNENMYELELLLEEKGTGLKASLPFQLVVTMPSVNETVSGNETTVIAVVETVAVITPEKTVTLAIPTPVEEAKSEKTSIWRTFFNWLMRVE